MGEVTHAGNSCSRDKAKEGDGQKGTSEAEETVRRCGKGGAVLVPMRR